MRPLLLVLLAMAACAPAAESAYEVQQLGCVDEASTKEQADACRARVKAAWATDGGVE